MIADAVVIVCERVERRPEPTVDSVLASCAGCDEPIWVATDAVGRANREDGATTVAVCGFCVGR